MVSFPEYVKRLCVLCLITFSTTSFQVVGFKGTVFQFTHEVSLPSGIKLRWTTKDPEWITFEMSSPTKGYIGIGLNRYTGSMVGSDLYIGWVDSSGTAHIKDYFGTTAGIPMEDPQQDAELIAASENEHGTMIVFKRKWDTCDNRDYIIGDDTFYLLWAWGHDDPSPDDSTGFHISYHGNHELSRGATGIHITSKQIHWKFPDEEEKYPTGILQHDFVNSIVQVPRAEAYHHCKIIKFPQLQQEQHILAYKMLSTPESQEYIHRVMLHKCRIPPFVGLSEEIVLEKYVDLPGWNCYEQYPSDLRTFCSYTTVAILGKGHTEFKYPDHVGVEIGDTTSPSYYRLEIQYENPEGAYITDNSGIRVFYTSTLRDNEAGLFVTGHRKSPFMTIPPHQAEFNIYGLCSAECMGNGLSPEGTKIVAVQLHTHWLGKKAQLRHIRNGKELPSIVIDNNLRPNYQQYRLLPREVSISPGDQLVLQCTYETTGNETVIFGGVSRSEETCEAVLIYYPKSRLTDCRSQPELYQYLGAVGIMNATGETFRKLNVSYSPDTFHDEFNPIDDSYILDGRSMPAFNDIRITSPTKLKNRYLYDYLSRLNWKDDFFSKIVEQKWKNGLHYMYCTGNGGKKIPTSSHVVPYPIYEDYTIPAEQHDKCFQWGKARASSLTHLSQLLVLVLCFIPGFLLV